MTIRKDVSLVQNKWHDAQRVEEQDMLVEQTANNQIHAGIIQNHFGSGVLLNQPEQLTLFDSDSLTLAQSQLFDSGNFDGIGMLIHTQPSDINQGNQLEVELSDSNVFGRLSVKVAIIGLGFDGTLQIDRFYFYKNEKQVTSKHYKHILSILFNDFKGNNNCSRNNGGTIIVREAKSFQLSRDPIMVSQDLSPDLFWRDYKTYDPSMDVGEVLQAAIGTEYNVDALNVDTGGRTSRQLEINDVTTQYGQKFKAETANIQKITLLLGVTKDDTTTTDKWFNWNGDLVVSVFELQNSSMITCPSAIVPELGIEFDPSNLPIAQLSFSQSELKDYGFILTDALQPVDFIFRGTKLDSDTTSGIVIGSYYVVTVKRGGAATAGTLLIGTGEDRADDSRETIYGGVWVDVTDEDLWFQVWTDAAKIADGNGYDAGVGIQYKKTTTDPDTGAIIDNQIRHMELSNTGEDVINIGVIQSIAEESQTIQDERTGTPINALQQFVPSFSFVSSSGLSTLKETMEPVIIGAMKDTNPKVNDELIKIQDKIGMVSGDTFCVINPDADLLSLNLLGSKLTPNNVGTAAYRIMKVTLCTDRYGSVINGLDAPNIADIAFATTMLGEDISTVGTQNKILAGDFSTLQYYRSLVATGIGPVSGADIDLLTKYVNKEINSFPAGTSFTHLCMEVQPLAARLDSFYDCGNIANGSDGYEIIIDGYVDPVDGYIHNLIIDPATLSPYELEYYSFYYPIMLETDPVFTTTPFAPVTYKISPQSFWMSYNLIENSGAKLVPAAFSYDTAVVQNECGNVVNSCTDLGDPELPLDVGRNDFFVPNNLIIGDGQILRPDGEYYRNDLEIATVELRLPDVALNDLSLNIFTTLCADMSGTGFTSVGYPAMRYADCSTVKPGDLVLGKIKATASLSSIVPNVDGYSFIDGYFVIVDDVLGCFLDQATGVLTISSSDLYVDNIRVSLISKILLTFYLKKAGWNIANSHRVVTPTELINIMAP